MATTLLIVKIRGKRDVLKARRQARQIARLLGFNGPDQAYLGAVVFESACQALHENGRSALYFRLHRNLLQIVAVHEAITSGQGVRLLLRHLRPESAARIHRIPAFTIRLPEQALSLDRSDLTWVMQMVTRQAPLDVFEEFRQMNQELLQTVRSEEPTHSLRESAPPDRENSSAA